MVNRQLEYRKRNISKGRCKAHPARPLFTKTKCRECSCTQRLYDLKRRSNLSPKELEKARKALLAFDGYCPLCKRPTKGAIDHCHKTHRFRGILCAFCNSYLAIIKDNPEVSDRVSAYLRKGRISVSGE